MPVGTLPRSACGVRFFALVRPLSYDGEAIRDFIEKRLDLLACAVSAVVLVLFFRLVHLASDRSQCVIASRERTALVTLQLVEHIRKAGRGRLLLAACFLNQGSAVPSNT